MEKFHNECLTFDNNNYQLSNQRNTQEPAREQMHEIGSTVTPSVPERSPVRSHPGTVSSHILDTTLGKPAANVAITMSRADWAGPRWRPG